MTPSQVAEAERRAKARGLDDAESPPRDCPDGVPTTIHFEAGSAAVTGIGRAILEEVSLSAEATGRVAIVGHTDAVEPPALSIQRAAAAGAVLKSAGMAPVRITTTGAGSSRPIVGHNPTPVLAFSPRTSLATARRNRC